MTDRRLKPGSDPAPGPSYPVIIWLPAAVAILLALPSFGLPFLWDDLDFMAKAQAHDFRGLVPVGSDALYRPISRELYFGLVNLLTRGSPVLAHIMNAGLVVACCFLLVAFVRRFSNRRSSVIAGFIFSAAAALPMLVGWISGSQDLLCILFSLAAYLSLARGRTIGAIAFYALAVFSKETAVALAPALIALAYLTAPDGRKRVFHTAAGSVSVLLLWLLVHPWVRHNLHHPGAGSASQYVSFQGARAVAGFLQGIPSLFNISWSRNFMWNVEVVASGFLAIAILVLGIRHAWLATSDPRDADASSRESVLAIVGLTTILGPLVLTSAFIAHWSVYYAGISVIGLAMLAAPLLARLRWPVTAAVLALFLACGVLSRMAVVTPDVPQEQNLRQTARALKTIERELRTLQPTLPHDAKVYMYVQAAGTHGAYDVIYKNQPLKVWYRDSSIEVSDPLHLKSQPGEEFLFWISSQSDVFAIDPRTLQARSPGPAASFPEYQKTLRAFALGLAARGETDRAVSILTGMPQTSEYLRAYDRRCAAALLYAAGREAEGNDIARTTPKFRRSDALEEIRGLVAKPIPGLDLDRSSMRAFEIAPTDTSAVREIMRRLEAGSYRESAGRFAGYLLTLVPGDGEASRVIAPER